jgi:hypothetical protein
MAKSGDLSALRNKCAAVHNVALVAKNVEMAVLKARHSLGFAKAHADTEYPHRLVQMARLVVEARSGRGWRSAMTVEEFVARLLLRR